MSKTQKEVRTCFGNWREILVIQRQKTHRKGIIH
jgi:hypothetical protein